METLTAKAKETSYTMVQLQEMIASYLGSDNVPQRFKIITDTSDFFRVDYNDVVILAGTPYLMRNYTREGRFGLDDEPKYWVRKAIDLKNQEAKIIKLVFHEEIEARVGEITFKCVRSPGKEAAILEMVAGNKNFMQGTAVRDEAGNIVRILDFIQGKRFDEIKYGLAENHETFFTSIFRSILPCMLKWCRPLVFFMIRDRNMGISAVTIFYWREKPAITAG